jgi:hypothetical protein
MNTDQEQTRTIGHFDPLRPPFGGLMNSQTLSFRSVGTTHELRGVQKTGNESPVAYWQIGYDALASCPSAPNWLWKAKRTPGHYHPDGDPQMISTGPIGVRLHSSCMVSSTGAWRRSPAQTIHSGTSARSTMRWPATTATSFHPSFAR